MREILIQDRINQRGLFHFVQEPEDEPDLFFHTSEVLENKAVFNRTIHVSPPGGEERIISGTPLVEVVVHPTAIDVKILD